MFLKYKDVNLIEQVTPLGAGLIGFFGMIARTTKYSVYYFFYHNIVVL